VANYWIIGFKSKKNHRCRIYGRLDHGGQISELFIDGVHPNTKGYEVWAATILQVMKKLLKD